MDKKRRRGKNKSRPTTAALSHALPAQTTTTQLRETTNEMAGGSAAETVSLGEKVFWILAYSACSSSMLVINKLAVQNLPLPTVVSGAQLFVSAAVVVVMQLCGQNVMGAMEKSKVLPFTLYTAMFAGGLFANMKALMLTNVGAVIAARSCLPVIVCLIEWQGRGSKTLTHLSFNVFIIFYPSLARLYIVKALD